MAIKYREAEELRLTTRKNLASSKENWQQFLTTASNTYKYSFSEQVLIFAQFPKAKAVASFNVWSEKFGRRIRYNEKGIGLIDDTKSYPKMKYVFDISQSNRFKDVPQPYIWDLKDEYKQEAAISLSGDNKSIDEALSDLAENAVDEMADRYAAELLSRKKDSAMLAGLDDYAILSEFKQLVNDSVKYMTLKRCGLDTSLYMDDNAFENLNDFSELGITDILGGAVSDISEQVLREIENTVKTIERRNQNERTNEENQNNQRNTIHSERGRYEVLSDSDRGQGKGTDLHSRPENIRVLSESQRDGGHEGHRQVRTQEEAVSQREQTDTVYADVRRPQPDRPSDRGQRIGGATDGNARRTDDESGGRDRGAESTRPDEMGQNDELNQSESGRNSAEQPDFRIKNNTQPEKSDGTFKIYQLKSGEAYHFKRFEGLERQPEPVSISDYDLVYEGSLADIESGENLSEKLEAIFTKFNIYRPEDFTGQSLSVSDVVVIEQDGQQQAHFVDNIGFQNVPDFFTERTQKAEESVSPASFHFSDSKPESFEQVGFFESEPNRQNEIDDYVVSRLMLGTGTEDGKFRVNDFFKENHTASEKADFLKDEYGWSGSYTGTDEREATAKGLSLIHKDKENLENNISVFLKWNEVAKYIDRLTKNNAYITQQDIDERIRHAKYVLQNYNRSDEFNRFYIEQAEKILDSYNIDYTNLLSDSQTEENPTDDITAGDVRKLTDDIPENAEIPDTTAVKADNIDIYSILAAHITVPVKIPDEPSNSIVSDARQTSYKNCRIQYDDYGFALIGDTEKTEGMILQSYGNITPQALVDKLTAKHYEFLTDEIQQEQVVSKNISEVGQVVQVEAETTVDDFDYDADKFFFTEYGVEEIYYNPNSTEGGQFVISQISDNDILEAAKESSDTEEFFMQLEASASQTAIDVTDENFSSYIDRFNEPFDLEGGTDKTMNSLIERATKRLEKVNENKEVGQDTVETTITEQSLTIGNSIELDDKMWTIEEIDEDNNRIVLGRETGNIIIPHESMDLFLSDVINSVSKSQTPDNTEVGQVVQVENITNTEKTFAEQVDEALQEGNENQFNALKVCNTPQILLDVGCRQLPMLYTQKHLREAVHAKSDNNSHWHGLTKEQIKKMPELLENPVMIFDSLSRNDSIVVCVSDTDEDNLPLVVSVKPNGTGTYELEKIDSNFITSIYGRNNFESYIERIVNQDKMLYCNKEKSQELFRVSGLQLPKCLNGLDFDTIIHQSRNIVNGNSVDKTAETPDKSDSFSQSQTPENKEVGQVVQVEADTNYNITDDKLGAVKQSEKYQNNINAIKTLKSIEAENRTATKAEQEILSKYVGWGGLSPVFQPNHKCYNELKNLLTDSEYEQARKSTMTAFYTSPVIIREMYNKLADMGFKDGKLLEPSCGVGNFIGTIPDNINAKVTGIELDSITGRIAKQLYPDADIQVCGFENSNLKENSFDVAVGNVPFGDIRVYDKKYNKDNLLIHDYFFSKSLDMVKPGGVVAFITSKGTLDKQNDNARRLIAEKADFLGAVRLPNNAFKANAGTDVTSDIIFLQKRTEPLNITLDNEPLWIKTAKDENGIEMNAYFAENPQQICGTMEMQSTQYGFDSTCVPDTSTKLSEQIRNAMQNINGTISTEKAIEEEFENSAESVAVPSNLRNSSFFFSDGKPYFYENNVVTDVQLPKKEKNSDRLKGMIVIRDTVRQLLDMQLDENTTDDEIKAVQKGLSNFYDDFTVKFGRLNSKENTSVFKNDSSLPLLKSLEKINQQGEFIGKADIFSKRTVKAQTTVTSVSSSVDALAVSLSETAKVDLDYMSQLTGFDKDKIVSDLKGAIFALPNSDKYVTADEYLSGDILAKLEEAQKAYDGGDDRFADNIAALNKAMPKKLEASEIDVRLGATWIKPEYIRDFVYNLLGTPAYHKMPYMVKSYIDVQYSDITGKWFITNKSSDKFNVLATTTYGTKDKTAYQLIEDALNLKSTTVKKREEINGKEQSVVDRDKTVAVQAKQDLIKEKFKEWIFADKDRRDDVVNTYNRLFNTTRNREYDGKYLNFVGMNPEIELRPHQLNAVARCLYGGNTLLAHEVGAGKTFEMIAAAMEGKRLGLHSKSMFCVPNHLTEQIGADFLKLYPNANILVATKKDFEKQNRKNLMAKIATGNYDAVIIGHSQLSMIPVSVERQEQFIQNQIDEVVLGIRELKFNNGENFQIKQMEKTKQNLETKLQKLLDSPKDDTVTFEQLGVDKLFLDEAHEFKNLFLSTKMTNVSGVTTSDNVQKTADLFMKTQYLDEITNSKGLVFATGTPVSNSMCEIYNMMKYLQTDLLQNKNLYHFDSWASTFGENVTKSELAPEGNGYRVKTRFSKFYNLPELMSMFKECADIQTADTLNLPGIPECEIHNVAVEPTEMQKELVESLSERASKIHNREVEPYEDNMLKITTDGKKIGLDQRLINPDLPDEPGTKVNVCVDNVFNIWDKTKENKSTQLVFCDTSTPKGDGSFNLYDDIKNKLVAKGIPSDEIAFIHEASTEEQKEKLFAKVRAGEVRVLIGSTKKMGAGTNVQDRLVASHDLDAPYKPSDMEQRRGRMVRQGNKNKKVDLYRYCTKDTFDAYLFQMLERKQKFIGQVMTSKSPQRRCDDIDEAALSYAEVKALCVGDPRIKEKMELDVDVAKLQVERSNYQQEQYNLQDKVAEIEKKIDILKNVIPKNQNDFLNYTKNHPVVLDKDGKKVFEGMTIGGTFFNDKKEAAEAFKSAYIKACSGGSRNYVSVGKYKDFDVGVVFDPFSQAYKASLTGEATYYLELGSDNFTRMDNVLDKLQSTCEERIARLEQHKTDLKQVQSQIGKPFEKEAEYQEKTARLSELNSVLDIDGKKDEMGGIEKEPDVQIKNNAPKR